MKTIRALTRTPGFLALHTHRGLRRTHAVRGACGLCVAVLLLLAPVALRQALRSTPERQRSGQDTALAQTGGPYDLTWSTIDGGGTFSTGGAYTLGGTIGQPDAGVMTGGTYTLGGGFWGGGAQAPADYKLYLPLVLRDYQ